MDVSRKNQQVTGRNMDGVMAKWDKQLRAINEAFDGKADDYKLLATSILLENTAQHLAGMSRLTEATQPADVSYFKKYAINLLSAFTPNLIAFDLVSVQPMLSRIGEIRYLRVLYGSDKGKVNKGSTMFSNLNGGDFTQHSYTSDLVEEEAMTFDGTATQFSLDWTPVIPGSVEIVADTDTYKDNGSGDIMLNSTKKGTINYDTGAVVFTAAPDAASASVNYAYDNMTAPVQAPELVLKLVSSPIQAKSRKLKTLYAFDAA